MADQMTPEQIATRIARDLFTNGSGERAKKLNMEGDEPECHYLGGWGEKPMADRIAKLLRVLTPRSKA